MKRQNLLKGMIGLTVFMVSALFFLLSSLFYRSQMNQLARIAGIFPGEEQRIVDALISGNEKTGTQLLAQYGISDSLPFWWNSFLKDGQWQMIGFIITGTVILLLLWIVYYQYEQKQIKKQRQRLLDTFDKILNGQIPDLNPKDAPEFLKLHQLAGKLDRNAEQLKNEKKRLQSIVTDISHQIKTPVASIRMFNDFLIEGGQNQEEIAEFLQHEHNAIQKLEWLSQSLLLISRLESGLISIEKSHADLFQTVSVAVSSAKKSAEQKGIQITLEGCTQMVPHDRKWTGEAVFNLLDNAVKYGKPGGKINITVIGMDTTARVDVEDDGGKLLADEIPGIFQRFYRGNAAKQTGADGAGIGLYLTRSIIEAQHGSLTAEITTDGKSLFRIYLTKL